MTITHRHRQFVARTLYCIYRVEMHLLQYPFFICIQNPEIGANFLPPSLPLLLNSTRHAFCALINYCLSQMRSS